MEEQIQKAVDCYSRCHRAASACARNPMAGSKRLSMFNELIAGVRKAVPEMVIQVGGLISDPRTMDLRPNGSPTTRGICWPNSIRSPTR
ncbi:hypothetical protein ACU4GD_01415 [Cupriavidus basilensis]